MSSGGIDFGNNLRDGQKRYFGNDRNYSLRYDVDNDNFIIRDEANSQDILEANSVGINIDGDLTVTGATPVDTHDLAGSEHNSGTLSDLNTKISDATLDDEGDSRDPTEHNLGGTEHGSDSLSNLNSKIDDATLDDEDSTRTPKSHASTHNEGGSDEITDLPAQAFTIIPTDNWQHSNDDNTFISESQTTWKLVKTYKMDTYMGDVRTRIDLTNTFSDSTGYGILTVNGEPDGNNDWEGNQRSLGGDTSNTYEEDVGITLTENDELQLYLKTNADSGESGNVQNDIFDIGYDFKFVRDVTKTTE